jgi:hypothetical protein
LLLLVAGIGPALAQDNGTLNAKQTAPLAHPDSAATPPTSSSGAVGHHLRLVLARLRILCA